ncbi:MAG: uracil-DNA glycosylase [Hyphomonadaceae bacterium]
MAKKRKQRSVDFVAQVSALEFPNTFNPYSQICPTHDDCAAAKIRRQNLEIVLDAAIAGGVDSIWIARDLGYRGGRRTGLALTDELHLGDHAALIGADLPLSRATKGAAVGERTATVVWQVLRAINRPIFLWNVFPLHPHEPSDPLSNRCHTRTERVACRHLLTWLLAELNPSRIVTIGRDAYMALAELEVQSDAVRHPSYGGQTEFAQSLEAMYGVKASGDSEQGALL